MNIRFLCILVILVVSACSHDDEMIGAITFTSSVNCDIRLFDSRGRQVGREYYEVGKNPAVIQMKSTGIFIVHATNGNQTIKEPITYIGGNLDYYLRF